MKHLQRLFWIISVILKNIITIIAIIVETIIQESKGQYNTLSSSKFKWRNFLDIQINMKSGAV